MMMLACNDSSGDDSFGPKPQPPEPPELIAANLEVGGSAVILRFSEPVIVPEDIDPLDFRISVAWFEFWEAAGEEPEEMFMYRSDPNYYANGGTLVVASVIPGESDDEVVLEFGVPIDPMICALIHEHEQLINGADGYGIGLLPHYAQGVPPLTGLDGAKVLAFGHDWVRFNGLESEQGSTFVERALESKIEIPCVF
jgi:hypothetical protein